MSPSLLYLCVMDNKQLNTLLLNEALSLRICDKVLGQWNTDKSDDELVAMGYKNIDFLLEHHWPSNQTLKNIWTCTFMRSHGIFVDDKWSMNNAEQSIILGGSKVTMRYNGWNIGRVYVRDSVQVSITAKNKSTVIVHAFENAWVKAKAYDDAKILVIRHSDMVRVTLFSQKEGMATVKDEFGYLD